LTSPSAAEILLSCRPHREQIFDTGRNLLCFIRPEHSAIEKNYSKSGAFLLPFRFPFDIFLGFGACGGFAQHSGVITDGGRR
jgi:hypothetical protein